MHMKLVTCLLGAVLMLGTMTACGDDGGDSNADDDTTTTSTTEEADEADEPTGEPTDEPTDEPTEDSGGGGVELTGDCCAELKSASDSFDTLDEGQVGQFEEAIAVLQQLGSEAPSEIADDWQVLTGALDIFEQALADAGLTMADLTDPSSVQDLDPQVLQELTQKLDSLDSKKFDVASEAIEEHAKSECGIDMS